MTKRNLIVVNGFPRAGKDTFIDNCIAHSHVNFQKPILSVKRSSIDRVKEMATELGWDGLKTDENRNMLSEYKDFLSKYFDLPFKDITTYLDKDEYKHYSALYSCARESDEIQKLVDWGAKNDYKVTTVLIRGCREKIPANASHSDLNVLRYEYDYVIFNNGTEYEFHKPCQDFINKLVMESGLGE